MVAPKLSPSALGAQLIARLLPYARRRWSSAAPRGTTRGSMACYDRSKARDHSAQSLRQAVSLIPCIRTELPRPGAHKSRRASCFYSIGRRWLSVARVVRLRRTDAGLLGNAHQVRDGSHSQLVHHAAAMQLDGLFDSAEVGGDLLVEPAATTWLITSFSRGASFAIRSLIDDNSLRTFSA